MAAEAEFDREATQMLRNMGLEHDADALNFFLSDKSTSGGEKWKEVLRKPSPPSLRRFPTSSQRESRSKGTEQKVEGSGLSDSKAEFNGRRYRSKLPAPRTNPSSQIKSESYSYLSHQPVVRAKSLPVNGKGNNVHSQSSSLISDGGRKYLSPSPQNFSSGPEAHAILRTTAVNNKTYPNTTNLSTPSTVKVKSSLIPRPLPAHVKSTGPSTKTGGKHNGTQTAVSSSSTSGTKVLHSSKPSLKLLSVTTSTSTRVQSVADRSQLRQPSKTKHGVPPAVSHQHLPSKLNKRYSTPPAISMGAPRLSTSPVHEYRAYDRLEGYQKMRLTCNSPEHYEGKNGQPALTQTRIASPTSVNSDASQGSNASQKSVGSVGMPEMRSSSISSRKSGSNSRTPTPTIGHTHINRSTSNSSGEFYCTTNGKGSLSALQGTNDNKNTSEMNLHATSSRPNVDVSASATSTVQSLNTLMEVVTPATYMSTEHQNDTVLSSQGLITEHHLSSNHSSPSELLEPDDVAQAEVEQVPNTESHTSGDSSPQEECYLKKPSTVPLPHKGVNDLNVNPGKQKTNIPTSIKAPLSLSSKQRRTTKPPPIHKQKKPPLSPPDTCSSLLSPPVSYRKSTANSTLTAGKSLVEAPHLGEEHQESRTSNDVEDKEDFFGKNKYA